MEQSEIVANLSELKIPWVVLIALLIFQSVYPSSWSVLIKIEPVGSEVDKMQISAGILYFEWISIISPTWISSEVMVWSCPFLINLYLVALLSLSLLYLLKSSYAYFARVRVMTSIKGDR